MKEWRGDEIIKMKGESWMVWWNNNWEIYISKVSVDESKTAFFWGGGQTIRETCLNWRAPNDQWRGVQNPPFYQKKLGIVLYPAKGPAIPIRCGYQRHPPPQTMTVVFLWQGWVVCSNKFLRPRGAPTPPCPYALVHLAPFKEGKAVFK